MHGIPTINQQNQRASASVPVSTDAGQFAITVSIGAASLTSSDTAQDLLQSADELQYLAK